MGKKRTYNGKNRSTKSQSRERRGNDTRDDRQFEGDQKAPVRNNAHMYFTNEELAKQMSDFSFNQFLGVTPLTPSIRRVGSVVSLRANPSIGWTEGNQSEGINNEAIRIYTALSASNAKNTLYAPQDISTLIAALGQVYAMVEVCKRGLGVMFTYNQRNRMFPYGIVKTMGFDVDDLRAHMSDYRTALNAVINQLNNIPMFDDESIQYFKKSKMIYSGFYSDSESPMAQYYIVVPETTWIVDETSYEQGTILKTLSVGLQNMKMIDFITQVLQPMVTALLNSATFNYIYSDILRLAGEGSMRMKLEMVPADYAVLPEYNPMMLLQFHNANITGPLSETTPEGCTPANDVYPDMEHLSLVYKPHFSSLDVAFTKPTIINFPHSLGNPDLDQRIDVSRYKVLADPTTTDFTGVVKLALPDYYFTRAVFLFYNGDELKYVEELNSNFIQVHEYNLTQAREAIQKIAAISQWDYCPIIKVVDSNGVALDVFGDLDYFTEVDFNYLSKLDNLAMMGLFALR